MHTVPQTQTNSVSLYLHYFSFRLEENSQNTTICISDYEYSNHMMPAVFLHHSCKGFYPFYIV